MKICVYTSLFGRYDGLIEQVTGTQGEVDFICFTDDATVTSNTWQVRVVEPAFRQDSVRSARLVKILGHPSLDDYDITLYVDASVRLREKPEVIVADWLRGDVDFALARHSYREQLLDEFDEVIRLNYDDRTRVYEQLSDYATAYPGVLERPPFWTGMMVRRRSSELDTVMRTWADHVLRYSRRDQLSLPAALDGRRLLMHTLELDNFSSKYHEWPVIDSRRVTQGKAPELPFGPLVADLRRARRRIAGLEATETALREELAMNAESLREAYRQLTEQAEQIRAMSGVRGAAGHLWRSVGSRVTRRAARG